MGHGEEGKAGEAGQGRAGGPPADDGHPGEKSSAFDDDPDHGAFEHADDDVVNEDDAAKGAEEKRADASGQALRSASGGIEHESKFSDDDEDDAAGGASADEGGVDGGGEEGKEDDYEDEEDFADDDFEEDDEEDEGGAGANVKASESKHTEDRSPSKLLGISAAYDVLLADDPEATANELASSKKKKKRRKKKKSKKATVSSKSAGDDGDLLGEPSDYDLDPDAETKRLAVTKSQRIMEQRYRERERVKQELIESRHAYRLRLQERRLQKQQDWKVKLERSPFLVNLMAERERIEEENKMRAQELARRQHKLDKRRSKVKNEIILKALQEASDLDALRAEKRLIMEEERRLKALIEVGKTSLNRKQDLMAAMRAEKQRKQMQVEYRRQRRMKFEHDLFNQHQLALRDKLGLAAAPASP